jgi:hypothetical protein
MWIEVWERLRGYDRWSVTEAAIVSSQTIRRKFGLPEPQRSQSRFSADLLTWKDCLGEPHFAPFLHEETSPLYQLLEGETIRIRFHPSRPDRFYNREHFLSWIKLIVKGALGIALGGGLIVWRIWHILKYHS